MFFDFFSDAFESRRNSLKWWWWRALIGIVVLWVLYLFFLPFCFWLDPIYTETLGHSYSSFWTTTLTKNIFFPFQQGWKWFYNLIFHEPRHYVWSSFFAWKLPLIPTFLFFMYELWLFVLNPYTFADQTFGDTHVARDDEIKKILEYEDGYELKLSTDQILFVKKDGFSSPRMIEYFVKNLTLNKKKIKSKIKK